MKRIILVVIYLFVFSAVASSYGLWTDSDPMDEVMDYIEQLENAIEIATNGRSAHPAFLEDLMRIAAGLRGALDQINGEGLGWEAYGAPNRAAIPNVNGSWNFRGGTGRGALILFQDGPVLTGTLLGDKLVDGTIDAQGNIYFIRSGCNQIYTGVFDPLKMEIKGHFDCPVTKTSQTSWTAEK